MPGTAESAQFVRLETQISNLTGVVGNLTMSVDKLGDKVERLSVLEERQATTTETVDRAFAAIAKNKDDVEAFKAEQRAKHAGYDRYIYMAVGFVAAVSLAWSVAGYQVNMSINGLRDRQTKFDEHLAQSKIRQELRAAAAAAEAKVPN